MDDLSNTVGFNYTATAKEVQFLHCALSFQKVHIKILSLFHFGQTNFLRCHFLQGLFFIEKYLFF